MSHYDATHHTRGTSRYVGDLPEPEGLCHAAIVPSPLAHGKLVRLDSAAALALPEVIAVITAGDIPGENQIGPLIQDEELLASETVHFSGQPLAIVVAETPELARRAAGMIRPEIVLLPIITDPREAFDRGEIIGATRQFVLGNVESAWAACDVVVEGRCDIGGQEHVYLETQGARALPGEGDAIKLYSSTQSPYVVQRSVAKVLGVPYHLIEVDVKRIGGGFGGKEDQATPWACLAALACRLTGRPVELILSRHDDLLMTGKRHAYSSDFKIGLDKTGKILAYAVRHYQNAGASADLSPAILERTLFHSTNAYYIPNVHIFAASCRTNIPPATAFRGFGGPQGMFVIESAIAKAAEALGIPREEIQRRNLIREGQEFPYGQQAERARAEATWEKADALYDLAAIHRKIEQYNRDHYETKKGLAVMPICFGISFTATFMNQGSALVHIYTDGSVSISTGAVEMGQGISSKLANITARTLGIGESRIKVESTNTTRIANMSPSAASATTDLCGGAAIRACEEILARLRRLAARELQLGDETAITIENEQVRYQGQATGWSWRKLVETAYFSRISLSAHAFYATPNIYFDKQKEKGRPFNYHVYGTAILEATVDCLRGTYDIDAVKIVHDLGRPLNAVVDLGQIEGGLAQGLGWMTVEDLQFDHTGKLLAGALANYKLPEVYFMPEDLQVNFLENDDNPNAPYGSKAVGEPPLLYGLGVFFALRNAARAFRPGKTLSFHAPMTPERLLLELYGDQMPPDERQSAEGNGKTRQPFPDTSTKEKA
ncbi:MAG: molybdopterin-dependent oxidoreductase [Calditrichae bacterium]|nr:molybdopterin-dependent oxidoreductase [Calditrichia bacterium]